MTASERLSPVRLFAFPFRIFFFSVALMAVISVPLWVAMMTGRLSLPLGLSTLAWHQHEMIFGWLFAAIAGFLLTAVCVWTDTERTHGWPLFGLWCVWLLGRISVTLGASWPDGLVIAINLLFLPLVMLDAGLRIWRARQRRQLVILLVLAMLWGTQAGFLLGAGDFWVPTALVLISALMLIIGGRITPNFSAGWLRKQGRGEDAEAIEVRPGLELTMLSCLGLLLIAVVIGQGAWIGLLAVISAAVVLVRLFLWRGWRVRQEPLLWILHLSLLWIPVGFLLLAGAQAGWWPDSVWVHALGTGAMGGLILGVISRVVLGHTGRALVLPGGMVGAFALVHLAALLRVTSGFGWGDWQVSLMLSGLAWVMAYMLFLVLYLRPLMAPRADGKPG